MMKRKLSKAKSHELLLDTNEAIDSSERPVSPTSPSGIMSKMKKVLGSYGSSPIEKRRAQSLGILDHIPIFGVKLETLLHGSPKTRKTSLQHPSPSSSPVIDATAHQHPNKTIPHIVNKIIEHIERHGLRQEGIYRVNGNARIMESLKNSFDRTGDANLTDKDIFSVAGLLKLFLRELPVSLIPENYIDEIVASQEVAHNNRDEELLEIRCVVKRLPQAHYDLLQALCKHLLSLSKFSDDNKMTPVSLSIVFGPSVLKCGGGLAGLKKQGIANASFTKMIQYYSTIFEDNTLLLDKLSEHSTTDSFGSRFKKVRRKPKKPEPYHKHMEQKHGVTKGGAGPLTSDSCSTDEDSKNIGHSKDDMDEAIDQAFEAVIREDIEASTIKHRKSEGWLAAPITIGSGKPAKGLFQSDDITTRVSSPYSWKSSTSTGTSPTTSPAVTPRTSQVLTSLIGDTIQDHLFNITTTQAVTTVASSKEEDEISTSPKHPPSSLTGTNDDRFTTNNCSILSDEALHNKPSSQQLGNNLIVVRRSSAASRDSRKNRKSAIHGQTIVTSDTPNHAEKVMVDTEVKRNSGLSDRGSSEIKVSEIAKQLNNKGRAIKNKGQLQQSKDANTTQQIKPLVPPPAMTNNESSASSVINKVTASQSYTGDSTVDSSTGDHNEFDSVTRTGAILNHPTLQRIRGPMKRAKPSRRSMILKKEREEKQSDAIVSNGPSLLGNQTTSPELKAKNLRKDISVSSITSVTSGMSKLSSLSSPRSSLSPDEPSPTPLEQSFNKFVFKPMDRIEDTEESDDKKLQESVCEKARGIAPEDQPGVSKGAWSISTAFFNDNSEKDMDKFSFEELLKLAQKVRITIRDFDKEFIGKYGRKPSTREQSPISEHIQLLTIIKKKLKEIKSSEGRLSKTEPLILLKKRTGIQYSI